MKKTRFISIAFLIFCFSLFGCNNQNPTSSSLSSMTSDLEDERFKVTFQFGNGEEDLIKYVDGPSLIDAPTIEDRPGYEFLGWFDEDDNPWYFFQNIVDKDVTIIAKWELTSFIFNLDTNGGECENEQIVLSKQVLNNNSQLEKFLPTPIKKGYKFVEWLIYVEEISQYISLEDASSQYGYPLEKGLGEYKLKASYGDKIDLSIWCFEDDVNFINQAFSNFKEDNPIYADKTIDIIVSDELQTVSNLKQNPQLAADIFHFSSRNISDLVENNLLYEIDNSYVLNLGISDLVLEGGRIDGTQYAIPYTPNTYVMFYDASIYSQEDVKSLNKMLEVDVTKYGYDYNFALDIGNAWYLQSCFFSNGCTIFGENGNDSSSSIQPYNKALEVANWIWDSINGENRSKFYMADGSYYCGDTIAACVSDIFNADMIKNQIESSQGTYAVTTLPKIDFGSGEVSLKGVGEYKLMGINPYCESKELACQFVSYLNNQESQGLHYDMNKTALTNIKTFESYETNFDLATIAAVKQLENTFKQPLIYDETDFYNACSGLYSDLYNSTKEDVEDCLTRFLNSISQ